MLNLLANSKEADEYIKQSRERAFKANNEKNGHIDINKPKRKSFEISHNPN
jgi:hypothetical protein